MSPKRRFHPFALVALLSLVAGCSGLRLRPDGTPLPEECSGEAREAMARMGVKPDDRFSIIVDERLMRQWPTPLEEGPVVGYLEEPDRRLPVGTRFYGQAWTAGPKAIVRYYELQVPGGTRMPFCLEVRDGFGGQMKDPSSPPGVALLPDPDVVVAAVFRYGERDAIQELDRSRFYFHR